MKLKMILILFILVFPVLQFSQPIEEDNIPKELLIDPPIMNINEVQKGMKGFGLTVFEGVKPQVFYVEIIGVLKKDGPRSDLILARFSGGPLEKTGVIAGMSGSPVYINNKLVGAVSHAFPWSSEPIGAIRPIQEMLNILKKKNYKEPEEPLRFIPLETSLRKEFDKENPSYTSYQEPSRLVYVNQNGNQQTLVPIKSPVLFSGISDDILDIMRPEMESYGLTPINYARGGNAVKGLKTSKELMPGDAVGITLIDGDIRSAPVGTVTYRKGKDILMFGHPSMFRGPVSMPMTKEFIHTVLPSRQLSFKISGTVFEVGRIFEDRYSAVAGELGTFAKMIPVKVTVHNEGKKDNFNFRLVKDNLFFPNFLVTVVMQSAINAQSKSADTSIKFKFKITVKNLTDKRTDIVETNDFFTGDENHKSLFQGLFKLTSPIQALMYNPYVATEIVDIQAEIDIVPRWKIVDLVDIQVLKSEIYPGDEVPLLIKMREYKGKDIFKKVSIKIPSNFEGNKIAIGVGSAKAAMAVDRAQASARYTPKNYDHLLKLINLNDRFNDLAVWIELPDKGLMVEGQEHPDLPSSVGTMLEGGNILQKNIIFSRVKKYFRSNYFINGMVAIIIPVQQRQDVDTNYIEVK